MTHDDRLAILGGSPVVPDPLPPYRSVGRAEREAVCAVIDSGCLSGFYGSWREGFLGGPTVRAFERAWAERFGVEHAVSVNSATSGLSAALGAIGIGPGDEVIVPPLTMSATVVAPLIYGGIPVFADIEPETFCLDPAAVRRAVTPRTRAILAVNLFGHPARLAELRSLAEELGIALVEDNAQAPLAAEGARLSGTVGHIGVFSLNEHKHLHTGEGGMCVTADDDLAQRLRLIRNHGENVVEPLAIEGIVNLVGFNFRMTELSAAIGLEQLRRIDAHVERREALGRRLTVGAEGMVGLTPPRVRPDCRHVYYLWALRFDEDAMGIRRERFSEALRAEGFPNFTGYVRPLYRLPVFQRRIAIGGRGYPFDLTTVRYEKGLCPVAERMYERELICFEPCRYEVGRPQTELLIEALHKVYAHRGALATPTAGTKEMHAHAAGHCQH